MADVLTATILALPLWLAPDSGAASVTHRQARILDALDRMGDASQARLAREFNLTAASMSTMFVRHLIVASRSLPAA